MKNFEEFWLFYLREHAQPKTRQFHVFGTAAAVLILFFAVANMSLLLFILALISGYGFAWYSHFYIEKNRPASFKYPLWSLRADLKLFYMTITRNIDGELRKAGI